MFSDRASKKDQLVLLRLSASHVNALIEAESKRYHELDQNSGIGAVSLLDARSSNRHAGLIYYFISHQGKQYCLFNVTKDSETRENQEDLPYFGELFNVIKAQPEYAKKTILIPMRQCRGFLKFPVDFKPLQREHIVLVELDITAQTIRVHDSQSRLKYIFYPDHLQDIAKDNGFSYTYFAYDTQQDDDLCGYYVHQYTRAIIAQQDCRNIVLPLTKDQGHYCFSVNHTDQHYSTIDDYFDQYGADNPSKAIIRTRPNSGDAF